MISFSGGENVVKLRNYDICVACLWRDCHIVFVACRLLHNFVFLAFSSNCLPHSALHESR